MICQRRISQFINVARAPILWPRRDACHCMSSCDDRLSSRLWLTSCRSRGGNVGRIGLRKLKTELGEWAFVTNHANTCNGSVDIRLSLGLKDKHGGTDVVVHMRGDIFSLSKVYLYCSFLSVYLRSSFIQRIIQSIWQKENTEKPWETSYIPRRKVWSK